MNIIPILAAITATSTVLGMASAVGWRNALALRDDAMSELRRTKRWSDFFREQAADVAIELQQIKAARARRAAMRAPAARTKALIVATAERMKAGK